jgi:hypothetical protein
MAYYPLKIKDTGGNIHIIGDPRTQDKADKASPALTGTPAAPTAAADTNTTQIATTAFVVGQASSGTPVVNGTAAAGSSTRFARGDHVHPTDTSRAAATRSIGTTAPLTGGGDLSADRTLALSIGTGLTTSAGNLVPNFGTTSGTVAQGNDSRFSDARTPTSHASTHGSAGSDPITIAQSQVSGLTADLAAKAARIFEPTADGTISANLVALDLNTTNVLYIGTAPSANFTVNLTNAPTTDNQAITVTVAVVQGSTGFIPSALQVAGAGQTIKWQGGSAPTATNGAGKIDLFSFTLIRRSGAWTVFGSALGNF